MNFRAESTFRLWAGGMIVGLMLAGCHRDGDAGKAGAQGGGGNQPIEVVIQSVSPQPWTDTLQALGTVKAHESVTVTAKVSETVDKVHFESGQWVNRGAPLVTLTGQQQQAALAAAAAAAKEADTLYQRQSQLAAQQLIAKSMLDTQKATRDAAIAQVQQIRANLSDRVIRAPFSGLLGLRQVSPGTLVTPGTAIATLDDVSRVYVDFPVPETELANVASGQAVSGTTQAYSGREFTGTVQTSAGRLDTGSRAMTVRGDFPNPDHALKPGMLLNVEVTRGTHPAIVVPELAVMQVGSQTFVWRVTPAGKAQKVEVEVGGRIPGKTMIRTGLNAGDRIVVDGVGKVKADATLKAAAPSAAGAGKK
ncbi:efflux RND transporter periplasmic adaptor subunit [Solilutibacter silvestris]|uniref:efflux RND transporter periplasmic adaptor subunit n=1 Tax=Solilutibacter silvestris TaxID=1645665 RepID=UPI003D347331